MQRAVALRADCGRERMVVGLRVVADDFHFLFDEPLTSRRNEAGSVAEVSGPGKPSIGAAPRDAQADWAVLVKRIEEAKPAQATPEP